jgi:hypothetical protein
MKMLAKQLKCPSSMLMLHAVCLVEQKLKALHKRWQSFYFSDS